MQIVLARVRMDGIEFTGRYLGRYNTEPEVRAVPVAKACMWLNDGTDADMKAASAFAATEGYTVYVFEGETDPIGKAKSLALEAFSDPQEHKDP